MYIKSAVADSAPDLQRFCSKIHSNCGFIAAFDFPIKVNGKFRNKSAAQPQHRFTCCGYKIHTAGHYLCGLCVEFFLSIYRGKGQMWLAISHPFSWHLGRDFKNKMYTVFQQGRLESSHPADSKQLKTFYHFKFYVLQIPPNAIC